MSDLLELTRDGKTALVEPGSQGHQDFLDAGWVGPDVPAKRGPGRPPKALTEPAE